MNPANNNTLIDQIEKLAQQEDLGGLEDLINRLSPADLKKYKIELKDACLGIFHYWVHDLVLDKIKKEDQEPVIADLFALLLAVEKVDGEEIQYTLRAELYQLLADLKTEPDEKLHYVQKTIDEYTNGLQNNPSAELKCLLAHALLKRMQICQRFTVGELSMVLQWLLSAFAIYTEPAFIYFIHGSFKVLGFPFNDNDHWHRLFMKQLEASLAAYAKRDPVVYLVWSNELVRILDIEEYKIPTSYADEINKKTIELLAEITNYETDDQERLNQLGSAFEKAAKRMESNAEKLHYYEVALKYFLKGQTVNPAAWTFPVYATNVQMEMARIYKQQNDQAKVIALFEAGKMVFAKTYEYEKGFTLMHYWGKFLIEYARLAYDFNAPEILKEAESKLLIAKELGNGYYSQPYTSLAKVALKLGNKQQCIEILKECKAVFTTQYYEYDFSDVLKDKDFRDIWAEINLR